jgi:hypothetical protein
MAGSGDANRLGRKVGGGRRRGPRRRDRGGDGRYPYAPGFPFHVATKRLATSKPEMIGFLVHNLAIVVIFGEFQVGGVGITGLSQLYLN